MKKILKSILIATASIGTITASVATVVSCGKEADKNERKATLDEQEADLFQRWQQNTPSISKTLDHGALFSELVKTVQDSITEYKVANAADFDLLGDTIGVLVNNEGPSSTVKIPENQITPTFNSTITLSGKNGESPKQFNNVQIHFNLTFSKSQDVMTLQADINKWALSVPSLNIQARTYKDKPGTWGELVLSFYNSFLSYLNDLVNSQNTKYDYLGISLFTVSGHSTSDTTEFPTGSGSGIVNNIYSVTGDNVRFSLDAKFDDRHVRDNGVISNATFDKTNIFSTKLVQLQTEPTAAVEMADFLETWYNTYTTDAGDVSIYSLSNTWVDVKDALLSKITDFFKINSVLFSKIQTIDSITINNWPTATGVVITQNTTQSVNFSDITINYTPSTGSATTASFPTTVGSTALKLTIYPATVETQLDYFATLFSKSTEATPVLVNFANSPDQTASYANLSNIISEQAIAFLGSNTGIISKLTLLKNTSARDLGLKFSIYDGERLAPPTEQFLNLGIIQLHYQISGANSTTGTTSLTEKVEPILINNTTKIKELENAQVNNIVNTIKTQKLSIDLSQSKPRIDALQIAINNAVWSLISKNIGRYANLDLSSQSNIKVHIYANATDKTNNKELNQQQILDVNPLSQGKTVDLSNYVIVLDFLVRDYSAGTQIVIQTDSLLASAIFKTPALNIDGDQWSVLKIYEDSQNTTGTPLSPGSLFVLDPSIIPFYGRDLDNQLTAKYLEYYLNANANIPTFDSDSLNMFQQQYPSTTTITGNPSDIVSGLNNPTTKKDQYYLSLPVTNQQTLLFKPSGDTPFILPTAVAYDKATQASFLAIKSLNDYLNPISGTAGSKRNTIESKAFEGTTFKAVSDQLIKSINASSAKTGVTLPTDVVVKSIGNFTATSTFPSSSPFKSGPITIVLSIGDGNSQFIYAIHTLIS